MRDDASDTARERTHRHCQWDFERYDKRHEEDLLQKKKPPENTQNAKVTPTMMYVDERETARIMSGVGGEPSGKGETIPVVHLP